MTEWMDKLERLGDLRDKGLLTNEEFETEKAKIIPSGKSNYPKETFEVAENSLDREQDDTELFKSEIINNEWGDYLDRVFVSVDGNEVLCPPEMSDEQLGVALLTGDYDQELENDTEIYNQEYEISPHAIVNQLRRTAIEDLENLDSFPPELKTLCEATKVRSAVGSSIATPVSTEFLQDLFVAKDLKEFAKRVTNSVFLPDVNYTKFGSDFLFALAFIKCIYDREERFDEVFKGGSDLLLYNASILASALFPDLAEIEHRGKIYSSRELLYQIYSDLYIGIDKQNQDHRKIRQAVVLTAIDAPSKWDNGRRSVLYKALVSGGIGPLWGRGAIKKLARVIAHSENELVSEKFQELQELLKNVFPEEA